MARMSRKSADVFALMLPAEDRVAYVEAVAPEKSGARVAGGRLANARGKAWERYVEHEHAAASALGIAVMRKVGAPVHVGEGGLPVGWAGHGPADYQGFLRATGAWWRPVAVEAKSCEGRMQRDDVEPHQRRDLELVERVGGLALVLVELTADGSPIGTWAVPWSELERLWLVKRRARPGKAGSKLESDTIETRSVGPSELAGWEARPGCYLLRWAPAPEGDAP